MGISRFPHGILATPNIGGSRLCDIWNRDQIYFIDGDFGVAGNDGLSPDTALTKLSDAITLATNLSQRGASFYIRPRSTAASAQTYYQDDITVPITLPNLAIIGAGYQDCTHSQSGVQFKPTTVTGHLIEVKGAGLLLENMRLTLTGGTADQNKCIVHAVNDTAQTRKPSGLVVRGCFFANDKSHPSYSGTEAIAAIGLGSVRDVIIENNIFFNCLGGIAYQLTSGTGQNIHIRLNSFGGAPSVRDCDILVSIGDSQGFNIYNNIFSDGKPAHVGGGYGKFIQVEGAGTGIMGGNLFSTGTENSIIDATGTDCVIPTTYFCPGNFYEGATNTAPYGLATAV